MAATSDAGREVELLLVDDDPGDAELTLRALRRANLANSVHHVADGKQALDFLLCAGVYAGRDRSPPPRVVLLDIHLPGMDGLEVLRRLRANPRTARVPVVILTSSAEERDVVAGYDLHANSYIVKPVDFAHFSQAVETLGMYWLLLNTPPMTRENGGTG